MNKEDYISLEVARLLKEKGFDEHCCKMYNEKEESYEYACYTMSKKGFYNADLCSYEVAVPTLYDAQKWLRERGYYVEVGIYDRWEWSFVIYGYDEEMCITMKYADIKYNTYEEALNAGILAALELI